MAERLPFTKTLARGDLRLPSPWLGRALPPVHNAAGAWSKYWMPRTTAGPYAVILVSAETVKPGRPDGKLSGQVGF